MLYNEFRGSSQLQNTVHGGGFRLHRPHLSPAPGGKRFPSSACSPTRTTRDSLLDHAALADAILSQNGHLSISPQFYFYILTRSVLRHAGWMIARCAIISPRCSTNSRARRPCATGAGAAADGAAQRGVVYLSDLLLALREASPAQAFFLRARLGDYTLFLTGMFPENIERRRSRRGAPGCSFYEEMGRASYRAAASHEVARHRGLTDVFNGLAEQFHEVRLALNELADRLLNLDDDSATAHAAAGAARLNSPHYRLATALHLLH